MLVVVLLVLRVALSITRIHAAIVLIVPTVLVAYTLTLVVLVIVLLVRDVAHAMHHIALCLQLINHRLLIAAVA